MSRAILGRYRWCDLPSPSRDSNTEGFGIVDIFSARPTEHLSDEQRAQRFWMGVLYASVVGYWIIGTTILVYALATWALPDRLSIVLLASGAILSATVCHFFRYRIVALSWRLQFFSVWNVLSFVSLATQCWLDGGIGSVLTFLFWLPMLYLALGFPLIAVRICGLLGLLVYATLVLGTPEPMSWFVVIVNAAALFVGWLLALIGAANRRRQDRESKALRRRLEKLAITDDLTGCLNQRAFTEALDNEIKRGERQSTEVALLAIDIDHFKRINDSHGHLMGDEALRRIGEKLHHASRAHDIAGRPGGDELAILAPDTGVAEARALAHRLQQSVRSLNLPIEITLSIGIDVFSPTGQPAAAIFRRADQALYEAKRRGRDQSIVYGHDFSTEAEDECRFNHKQTASLR